MASPANLRCSRPTFHLRINHSHQFPQKLSFPLFSRQQTNSTTVRFPVVKASSSSPSNPKPSLLKTTFITLTAAAAIFSSSLYLSSRHARVAISPEEATLEKHLETESNDEEALLSLMRIKLDSNKHEQAIEILNLMIEIEPEDQQWLTMKARLLSQQGQSELAIEAFEEILAKDPIRVDAYHYLLMEYCNSRPKLTELERRINEAIRICKKKKEISYYRMLIALIRFIEGEVLEASQICEELLKDNEEDYRIYLFQAMVYMSLEKKDEAAKLFQKIPEDHPYREIIVIFRATATRNKTRHAWKSLSIDCIKNQTTIRTVLYR